MIKVILEGEGYKNDKRILLDAFELRRIKVFLDDKKIFEKELNIKKEIIDGEEIEEPEISVFIPEDDNIEMEDLNLHDFSKESIEKEFIFEDLDSFDFNKLLIYPIYVNFKDNSFILFDKLLYEIEEDNYIESNNV